MTSVRALAIALLVLAGCGAPAPPSPPPVVLIVVDTLRADRLGSYGHTRSTTPRIDALAAESIRFDYALSQAPWTTPSVASLLSSRFPSELGIRDVTSPVEARFSWLPEELRRAGYATGAVVSHSFVSTKWGFDRGFDSFDESNVKGQQAITSGGVTDAAIAFVEAQADRPFLLLAHYFDPHFALIEHDDFRFEGERPYRGRVRSPAPYLVFGRRDAKLREQDARELLRLYDSEVAYTDHEIGRLLDHLRAQGLYERAIIVLTADHGEEFLEHGRVGHTRTLYDELVRVPLLLKLPGESPRVEREPAALVDVFPTVLAAAGLSAPDDLVGVDLLASPPRRVLFSETSRQAELRAVVRGPHKLVRDLRSGDERLYDRGEDPAERRDLSAARPELAADLAATLDTWLAARGEAAAPPPLELDAEERERLRQLGYDTSEEQGPPAPDLVVAPDTVFETLPPVPGVQAFDVVASDVDLDGDTDLLVNWHHVGALELLENRGGRFRAFGGGSGAGLFQDLYAPQQEMLRRIRARARPGLYLWHDRNRQGRWRFLWLDPDGGLGGLSLELETSLALLEVSGVSESEQVERGPRTVTLRLEPGPAERVFDVRTERIGVRLGLARSSATGGAPPPLFVGPGFEEIADAHFEVWKPDPHGMLWLDLEGDPHPELLVVRGALGGKLRPPMAAKHGDYFAYGPPGTPYRIVPGAVPGDYGRDRRVEAVDIDNDGTLEIWIGSRDAPNRLLAGVPSAGLRDRAAELGLDAADGAVGSWADHDADGWQDLYLIEGASLDLLRNVEGQRFERVPGATLGLELPEEPPVRGLFDPASLRILDVDRDGDLDLWLLGYGGRVATRVFLREGGGFRDATADLGLADAFGGHVFQVVDLDRDGYPDAVQLGSGSEVWHNRGGAGFVRTPLPFGSAARAVHGAAVLDANGDGAPDLVSVGRGRRLLLNRTPGGGRSLEVELAGKGGAVGSLVVAHYSDGTRQAMRQGSEHSTTYSQALQPLRFGIPPGLEIESVTVRWPGTTQPERYAVDGRARIRLER